MKKRKTQIAFSIFDKPSLAAFCIKIASLPEKKKKKKKKKEKKKKKYSR